MNWTAIFLRLMVLPILIFVGSLFIGGLVDSLAKLAPLAGALIAAVLILVRGIGLKRWETGQGPACQYCSGPLGFRRMGKRYYGKQLSDYQTCFNCGRHSPIE